MPEIRNVVLISIDSLRPDRISPYGRTWTSPFLSKMADMGMTFLDASSHGGSTPEAVPPLLKSIPPPLVHPLENPAQYRDYVEKGDSLAKRLHESGFETAAFHSNPYLSKGYGYGADFDHFDDALKMGGTAESDLFRTRLLSFLRKNLKSSLLQRMYFLMEMSSPPYERGESITARAIEWLKVNQSKKTFLWIHYMDCHYPYSPRQLYGVEAGTTHPYLTYAEALSRMSRGVDMRQKDINSLFLFYDSAIRYLDNQIRTLMDALSKQDRLTDTLVIFTADHGEAFGEHNAFGHGWVYQELLRVPLMIFGPGVAKGSRVAESVTHADVMPTVLGLMGQRSDRRPLGRDMSRKLFHPEDELPEPDGILSTATSHSHRVMLAYRVGNWKCIRTATHTSDGFKSDENAFYALRGLGREEKVDAIEIPANVLREIKTNLDSIIGKPAELSSAVPYDPEEHDLVMDRLKRLGYA